MLNVRKRHPSGTSIRSDHFVRLNPKLFTTKEVANSVELLKRKRVQTVTSGRIAPESRRTCIVLQQSHWRLTKSAAVAKEIVQLVPEKGELTALTFIGKTSRKS
jgi:hypothetical protein